MDQDTFKNSNSYKQLRDHTIKMKNLALKDLFSLNPKRISEFSVKTPYLYFDYSRQRINHETLKWFKNLAEERNLGRKIEAMFSGKKINQTEDRAVLHTALRNLSDKPVLVDNKDVMPEVKRVLEQIKTFSEKVLSGEWTGGTGRKIKNIVSIGIGGSYLGPEFLATALKPYAKEGMNLVFVANVDAADFVEKTQGLDPDETLIIIVSKTFTTAETMKNAKSAKSWVKTAINKHFVAVSTAKEQVEMFGIDSRNMFVFWDWVGGRFSATSAVGMLPLSLYLGYENAYKILEGAHWMDSHFRSTPCDKNIPVLSALLDIWNTDFLGFAKTRALLPYSQGLSKLPAHTQQVEMESNGKRVCMNGNPVNFDTGEVVFGEPGTNGQHSFYQLIHQGSQIIPVDLIGFINPQYELGINSERDVDHHRELMTNFLAQPDALAFGQGNTNQHKYFPGNRPSSLLLLEKLDPFAAGILLAWTEHRAATKGFIWGINSFDQFGVELGKVLGKDHRRRMIEFNKSGKVNTEGLNPATAVMLEAILKKSLPK